jgi:hypothetical protein
MGGDWRRVGAGTGGAIGYSRGYWDDERAVYGFAGALIGRESEPRPATSSECRDASGN